MSRPRRNGALRLQLESACRAKGCSQSALTVLSTRVDPYRLDTPANHRDATWLAENILAAGRHTENPIHGVT